MKYDECRDLVTQIVFLVGSLSSLDMQSSPLLHLVLSAPVWHLFIMGLLMCLFMETKGLIQYEDVILPV